MCAAERGSPPGDPSWQRANRGDPPPFGDDRSSVSQGDSPPLVPDRCAAERGSPPGDPSWQRANRGDPPPFGEDRSSVSQGDSPPLVPDRCAAERGSPPGDPSWQRANRGDPPPFGEDRSSVSRCDSPPLVPGSLCCRAWLSTRRSELAAGKTEAIHHRLVRTGAKVSLVTHRPLFPICAAERGFHQEIRAGSGQTEAIHHRLRRIGAVFLKVTHRPCSRSLCCRAWLSTRRSELAVGNRGDPPPFGADRSSVSQGDSPPLVPDRCAAERGSPPGDPSWQRANQAIHHRLVRTGAVFPRVVPDASLETNICSMGNEIRTPKND